MTYHFEANPKHRTRFYRITEPHTQPSCRPVFAKPLNFLALLGFYTKYTHAHQSSHTLPHWINKNLDVTQSPRSTHSNNIGVIVAGLIDLETHLIILMRTVFIGRLGGVPDIGFVYTPTGERWVLVDRGIMIISWKLFDFNVCFHVQGIPNS